MYDANLAHGWAFFVSIGRVLLAFARALERPQNSNRRPRPGSYFHQAGINFCHCGVFFVHTPGPTSVALESSDPTLSKSWDSVFR